MRIARIARRGATYDASAAAQTFSVGKMVDILEGKEDFSENAGKGGSPKESKTDFEKIPGFQSLARKQKDVNKVNLLKKIRSMPRKKHILRLAIWYFENSIRGLTEECTYQIKFAIAHCGGN